MWREKAENLSQYVKKGNQIMVVGEIDVSVFTNKEGQPAATLELTANQVQLLGSRGDGGGGQSSGSSRGGNNTEYEEVGDIPF